MELRKDYILDRWVYIATERVNRKHEFKETTGLNNSDSKTCFFCPGNEHTTPPEIGRLEEHGKWKIRWFPNKFPAVKLEGDPVIRTDNSFFTFSAGYGMHEVIAETPDHDKQLWDLPEDHLYQLLHVYKDRINALSGQDNIKYVILFKNNGREAGTSLAHSHTQIVSLNKIPGLVQEKINAIRKYDSCPYCSIIEIEKNSFRRCFENDTFIAFTPYASRFNYEISIFPKAHLKNLNEMSQEEFKDLASIMKKVLDKLRQINAPYNFYLHYSPDNEDLHFHIEFTPRFANWAGFEFSSNDIINSVSPEEAARFYRGEE